VVLEKIFGPKKDKVTRKWRRLRNEKLHFVYTSTNDTPCDQTKTKELGSACEVYGREER
jgi:hypothetical protein